MDDIKLFAKKRKRIGNPNRGSENIHLGNRDGNWHRKMRYANNEKRETTHDGRNGTAKSRKNRTLREKKTYKYLNIEVDTIKLMEKKKLKKKISGERESYTRPK